MFSCTSTRRPAQRARSPTCWHASVAAAFFEDVIANMTRDRESSMVRECSWLGAVSTHTNDYGRTSQIRASLDALLTAYPELCIALNHFDAGGEAPDTRSAGQRRQHGRLQVTWVPGMKGLFWKRVLTPERTRGMRMVWLFDADVAVHPSVMPLGLLASALLSSNASALQPLVRAAGMGTDHKWLRQRPSLSSCAASVFRADDRAPPLAFSAVASCASTPSSHAFGTALLRAI